MRCSKHRAWTRRHHCPSHRRSTNRPPHRLHRQARIYTAPRSRRASSLVRAFHPERRPTCAPSAPAARSTFRSEAVRGCARCARSMQQPLHGRASVRPRRSERELQFGSQRASQPRRRRESDRPSVWKPKNGDAPIKQATPYQPRAARPVFRARMLRPVSSPGRGWVRLAATPRRDFGVTPLTKG